MCACVDTTGAAVDTTPRDQPALPSRPSPHMFQGGRNYLGRARLGYTFFPLLPSP